MDRPGPDLPSPGLPADAPAALERRLAHLFRHASAPGEAPHPLLRLVRLHRMAQAAQAAPEPPHG